MFSSVPSLRGKDSAGDNASNGSIPGWSFRVGYGFYECRMRNKNCWAWTGSIWWSRQECLQTALLTSWEQCLIRYIREESSLLKGPDIHGIMESPQYCWSGKIILGGFWTVFLMRVIRDVLLDLIFTCKEQLFEGVKVREGQLWLQWPCDCGI